MKFTLIAVVLVGQFVVAAIVVGVLQTLLKRRLMETAVRQFEFWPEQERAQPLTKIVVITHKSIGPAYRRRIDQAAAKHGGASPEYLVDKSIKGGIVIQTNLRAFEFGLKSRLDQAFR